MMYENLIHAYDHHQQLKQFKEFYKLFLMLV